MAKSKRPEEDLSRIGTIEQLRKKYNACPVDFAGHRTGKRLADFWFDGIYTMPKEQFEGIERLLSTGSGEWAVVADRSILSQCYVCGEECDILFNGSEFRFSPDCQYPNGIEYEFELSVPSGKMIVANDLREYYPIENEDKYDINVLANCMRLSLDYAKAGLAHAFVGNTCPGIYKVDDDHYLLGVSGYAGDKEILPHPDAVEIGGVITDLWWYSICDYDDLKKRTKKKNGPDGCVVCVKPGTYRFRHLYFKCNRDKIEEPMVFTEIEWVKK